MTSLVFSILLLAGLAFFLQTMQTYVRAAARGSADPRPRLDQIPERIASVIIYFLAQKKVAEEGPLHRTSKHHLMIFWGFLVITIGTVDTFVGGVLPQLAFAELLPPIAHMPIKLVIDVFNLLVLLVICWALFRRIILKPALIPMNLDAGIILGAIACLMLTHFLYHGFHGIVVHAASGSYPSAAPVSNLVALIGADMAPGKAQFVSDSAYWIHVVILLLFLNYLPYSKHIHLLGALPNIFLRNLSDRRLDMPKLDLEDENQWGVGRFEQFSWKSLVDTYACTECARCSNYCPAYATEKNLSPMQLVHDIRYEMLDRDALLTEKDELARSLQHGKRSGVEVNDSPELSALEDRIKLIDDRLNNMEPMVGGRIAADTLWACTTCGACQEVCPVFIEHPLKIIQMRQNLVLEQEKVPAELGRAFRNIERQSNPWGISNEDRMDWAKDLEIRTIEDCPDPEYILWVGCAGAFDNRIIKQSRAMVKLLNSAGVDYAVLGHQEGCTGDPARRSGNEFLFQMQAESNVETLNEVGAKKVIASCPHCLHTLKNDYPQFGGNYEVIHHTQMLSHLLEEGRIKPQTAPTASVTLHDSCYLGRWNQEYDAPRNVLTSLPTINKVREVPRNKQHGFCCGAGGGRMFMEEHGPRINENRTDELLATGAETLAVACPFCSIMLTDGVKAKNKDEEVQVMDVSELLAQSIADVPVANLLRSRKTETEA